MKLKLLPIISFLAIFFAVGASSIWAAGLSLTSIGGVSTAGKTFVQWTHSADNPKFIGTAYSDAQVEILIDSVENSVTADSDGDWSYQPTSLTVGQYDIKITSGTQTIAFDLYITTSTTSADTATTSTDSTVTATSTDSATTKGGLPTELPATGAFETTLVLISSGLFLIGLGLISKAHFSQIMEK